MDEQRIPKGIHKGRAIKGSEQYGTTKNHNPQICLDVNFTELGERAQTILYFSDASAQYEMDRLRALGWEGDDLNDLTGIDKNEVDFSVDYEVFEGKTQMKVRVMTGGGRIVLQETMNDQARRMFAAKFKNLAAQSRGGSAPTTTTRPTGGGGGGGPTDFPFGRNQQKQGVDLG